MHPEVKLVLGGPEDGLTSKCIQPQVKLLLSPLFVRDGEESKRFAHAYVRCFDSFLYDGVRELDAQGYAK